LNLVTKTKPFDFSPEQVADPTKEAEIMRWIPWENLSEADMSLPIDKVVIGLLKTKHDVTGEILTHSDACPMALRFMR